MSNTHSINIIEDAEGELRVSSLIIAQQSDNEHRAVLQLIRANSDDLETFGDLAFEMRDRPGVPGPAMQVAHLNEQQATLIITYMKNTDTVRAFKLALVQEFYRMRQALAPQFSLPQTFSEALRELASSVEKNTELEQKIIADEPKVEYVDTYVADSDLRILRNVAKSIDMAEGVLRADLLERKWIYAEHTTRWSETKQAKETITRYSPYSHKAQYFEPVPNHLAPRFKGEVMHTLKITPAGATAIARLYGKHLSLVGKVA